MWTDHRFRHIHFLFQKKLKMNNIISRIDLKTYQYLVTVILLNLLLYNYIILVIYEGRIKYYVRPIFLLYLLLLIYTLLFIKQDILFIKSIIIGI